MLCYKATMLFSFFLFVYFEVVGLLVFVSLLLLICFASKNKKMFYVYD